MRFGPVALAEAEGAILAHATEVPGRRLRKSHRLTADDIAALREAGLHEVIAAVLEPDDVVEDEAAARVASTLRTAGIDARPPGTGRVNFHARHDGLCLVDKALIDAINRTDPAITVATLPEHARVLAGQMVATVKIIPFAVPRSALDRVCALATAREAFSVHGFSPRTVALIQTRLPALKSSILDKTARITAERLKRSGSRILAEERVGHTTQALAPAISRAAAAAEMVVIFGASAMCDPQDVIPAAIRLAGGEVTAVGMPVDPGNLLVLGRIDGKPVLGAPGCARSPKENGFDWVLDRLMAGIDVTAEDIAGMGVGGLLMEIPTRPQPRERTVTEGPQAVHAVILAAGRSSRMGGPNKLLAVFDGTPLVRRTTEAALASRAAGVTVVTGHQADRIAAMLEDLPIGLVDNPSFAAGLSTSLKAGIAAVPPQAAGAMVMLADMPGITAGMLDRLIDAFGDSHGAAVVRATHGGRRGNPLILPRALFADIDRIEGDSGARQILDQADATVVDVEIGEAASLDVDTPDAMARAGGTLV